MRLETFCINKFHLMQNILCVVRGIQYFQPGK